MSAAAPPDDPAQDGLASRVLQLLAKAEEPVTIEFLRSHLQIRNQRVVETIRELTAQGKVHRYPRGFAIQAESSLHS